MGEGRNHTRVAALAADVGVAGVLLAAAAVTGSSALFAGTVQSVAGTGSDALEAAAKGRGGRAAWFWALFGSIGLFAVGAALAIWQGINELIHPTPMASFALAYAVLAVAFAVELARVVRDLRRRLRLPEPREWAFPADVAALAGTVVAAAGVALSQVTGSVVPDALASVAIGVLLAGVGGCVTELNREFLAGERVSAEARDRIAGYIADYPGVAGVRELTVTFTRPDVVWVVARVEVDDGLSDHDVVDLVAGVERTLVQRSAAIDRVDIVPVSHRTLG